MSWDAPKPPAALAGLARRARALLPKTTGPVRRLLQDLVAFNTVEKAYAHQVGHGRVVGLVRDAAQLQRRAALLRKNNATLGLAAAAQEGTPAARIAALEAELAELHASVGQELTRRVHKTDAEVQPTPRERVLMREAEGAFVRHGLLYSSAARGGWHVRIAGMYEQRFWAAIVAAHASLVGYGWTPYDSAGTPRYWGPPSPPRPDRK